MHKIVALTLSSITALSLYAGDYSLDKSHSQVGFSVKHLGISNVKGYFKNFDGQYSLDEKTLTLTKLTGTVEVNSINTDIDKRDNHLKSADFFDVAKFPTMNLVMVKYKGNKNSGKLTANLTIKNVTKPVIFDVAIGGIAEWMGTTKSSMTLTTKINRKDFGLTWNKTLETGGFVVGDEVKITIDIEGDKN